MTDSTRSIDDFSTRGDAAAHSSATTASRCVLLLDFEPATADLLEAWLAMDGLLASRHAGAVQRADLLIVDLPCPRRDGARRLRQLAQAWPGLPVVAVSSRFFAGVATHGDVARQLGAAAVLAAPVAREALRAAVTPLLRRSG